MDSDDGRTRTRRRFLRGAGTAALAGATGLALTTAPTAAQSLLNRQMVFEEIPEELVTAGHYVVITDLLDDDEASLDPSVVDNCDIAAFGPEETRTYEGLIVNRLAQDPTGYDREILTNAREPPVQVGSVFIISSIEPCSSGYTTVDAEAVSESSVPLGTETPAGGGSGGPIPGFRATGAIAALAALLGLGRLDGVTED
jgi:hypothetical protein